MSYHFVKNNFGNFGNFGMSGAMKWYFGQHAKVCTDMSNGDLKQAINDAVALQDLGIQGKTYEEVIKSSQLLTAFKTAFNSFKGKMPSYSDEVITKGNQLLDKAIADLATNYTPPPGGKPVCEGSPPPSEADFYYHCCPSGWTKTSYADTQPCKGIDANLMACGALPAGATIDTAICCPNIKEWIPKTPGDPDPCRTAALSSGKAVPGVVETMLAPDIESTSNILPAGTNETMVFMLLGGGAIVLLVVTVIIKLMLR
jgi:hypothetical protein